MENPQWISFCYRHLDQAWHAAFLGVTGHYYTDTDKQPHQVTMAVKRFQSPHTGERIAQTLAGILSQWGIPEYKIFLI